MSDNTTATTSSPQPQPQTEQVQVKHNASGADAIVVPAKTSSPTPAPSSTETTTTTTTTTQQNTEANNNNNNATSVPPVTSPTVTTPSDQSTPTGDENQDPRIKRQRVPSSLFMKANQRSLEFVFRTSLSNPKALSIKEDDETATTAKKAWELGIYYLKKSNLNMAHSNFKQAVDLYPNEGVFLIFLAFTLLDQDKANEALELFNKAIHMHAVQTTSPQAQNNATPEVESFNLLLDAFLGLGHSYFDVGDMEKSLEYYTSALKFDDSRCDVLNGLGRALNRTGKYQEASTSFQKCLAIDSQYVKAWNNLGVVNVALGKKEDAINCFNKAVTIHQQFPEAWQNMGYVYQEAGQQMAADQCFRNADYSRASPKDDKSGRVCGVNMANLNVADCNLM